jgi:DNA repair protein RadC
METSLPERADGCAWVISTQPRYASSPAPFQLSFLSPLAGATADLAESACEGEGECTSPVRFPRRRRCRALKEKDIQQITRDRDSRTLLRKPSGEFIHPLYARPLAINRGGDVTSITDTFQPADPETIIASAEALLSSRLRPGVKILADPELLRRFLQLRLVSQRQPVFAAFFLDRKQRLIQFSEIARGENDHVVVFPKEVVRDLVACGAEQTLCVRSDPRGDHQPTSKDVEDARRVQRALNLLDVPLLDYVIVGQGVASLRMRGVL